MNFSTLIQLSCNDIKSKLRKFHLWDCVGICDAAGDDTGVQVCALAGVRNPPIQDTPYILWLSAACVPWIFFVDMMTAGYVHIVWYERKE